MARFPPETDVARFLSARPGTLRGHAVIDAGVLLSPRPEEPKNSWVAVNLADARVPVSVPQHAGEMVEVTVHVSVDRPDRVDEHLGGCRAIARPVLTVGRGSVALA